MRAGRLIKLMTILARRGRVTCAELAAELEVCERTVLRDLEELSGAGVPVYSTRGPGGGVQLIDGYTPELSERRLPAARATKRARRARVRITPEGCRLAALLGRLQPLSVRGGPTGDHGWAEATFRLDSLDEAVADLLSLGPLVVVLQPIRLRNEVATSLHRAAGLYPDVGPIRDRSTAATSASS